jgi:hypothetical protein
MLRRRYACYARIKARVVVTGINNFGQMVGDFQDTAVVEHGYIATPVSTPEPASMVLIGFGFAIMTTLYRWAKTLV